MTTMFEFVNPNRQLIEDTTFDEVPPAKADCPEASDVVGLPDYDSIISQIKQQWSTQRPNNARMPGKQSLNSVGTGSEAIVHRVDQTSLPQPNMVELSKGSKLASDS